MKQYQIDRIRELMDAKDINNQELASMCGISAMTIGRILNNPECNPTTDTVEKIAEALGVHEQYIYEAEGESSSKMPISGYIEYAGTISSIKTFKQLEKVYESIRYDMKVPRLAKELKAKDRQNKKSQAKTEIDINAIDLCKEEVYDTSQVKTWSFLHTDDVRNGHSINIGNFSSEHGLDLCGEHFLNSECAYIVGLFSQNTDEHARIQRQLQYEASPNDAKFKVRAKHVRQGYSRKDWDDFKHQWMLYVVWQKCLTNKEFAKLLKYVPEDAIIIENTTNQGAGSSLFWGASNKELEDGHDLIEREVELANPTMAKKELGQLKSIERNKLNNVGIWKGVNCLGKCLNICKYCLEQGIEPPIDYDLLRSKQIYLFGKLLTFDEVPVSPLPIKPKKKEANVAKSSESPTATKSQYRTVIFDFDGTLVDTKPLSQYTYLIKGMDRMNKEWAKAMKEYLSHVKDCKPYDGIEEVLSFIKENNVNAYVVTAGTKEKVNEAVKVFGWKGVFKDIISRHSIKQWQKVTKADSNPILFKKALYDFELDASDCISFGNEVVDTKAARKAGIEAYNAYWGAEEEDREVMDAMEDITIHKPSEIINILKSEPKEVKLSDEELEELACAPAIPNYGIMGAICGDILGSMYERKPYKSIPLDKRLKHSSKMQYTDDTVQTLAVAKWLMTDPDHKKDTLIKLMKRYGKTYKFKWHGKRFQQWIESPDNKPDDSDSDGSAMRVSPVAYYAKNMRECLKLAKITAEVSHNTQEGIYGAQASAAAIFMYLHGKTKEEIKKYITDKFGYDLNRNTDVIRPTYMFNMLCSKVVPESIICFLEGETYEDVVKLAISLGGDADTQSAISGAIAAAKMPIPQVEAEICYESLPAELKKTVTDFYDFLSNKGFPEPTSTPEPIDGDLSNLRKTEAYEGDNDNLKKKLKRLGIKSLEELYRKRDEIIEKEKTRLVECRANWEKAKPISWDDFSFRQTHTYDAQKQDCWSFNSKTDVRDGISLQLGNMANGYGVRILGMDFINSEVPYQLAIFKNDEASIKVQKEVADPSNPLFSNGLAMKRVYIYGKKYEPNRRDKDFELGNKSWCYEWMKWIVWEKVKQNKEFRDILLSIPRNAVIIEQAQKRGHVMWGCWNEELIKERKILKLAAMAETGKSDISPEIKNVIYQANCAGEWIGENAMGQILTMAKLALNQEINMPIDELLLNDAQINWFGKVLHFTKDAEGNVTVDAKDK